jgi:hypothetical protein
MLVAGLHNGNIAVYNLQRDTAKPSHESSAQNGKHKDIVWEVKWVPDNLDNYLNLYSVSGDGRVTNWTLIKCGLWFNDKLIINFDKVLENISKEMVAGHLMGKQASNFTINTLLVL